MSAEHTPERQLVDSYIEAVASQIGDMDPNAPLRVDALKAYPPSPEDPAFSTSESNESASEETPPMTIKEIIEHFKYHLLSVIDAFDSGRISSERAVSMVEDVMVEMEFYQNLPADCNMSAEALEARYWAVMNEQNDILNGHREAA